LEECCGVDDRYIRGILAALPRLVIIDWRGVALRGMWRNLMDSKLYHINKDMYNKDVYNIIRQWALDI
jgi:hypothetical protein